jgi:hypothetical protein
LVAEEKGIPIYVLRANSTNQMEQALAEIYNLNRPSQSSVDYEKINHETKLAIDAVLNGRRWVDLTPAPARIRRMQHEQAREANLISHSYGQEPNRHVRIFRE